MISKNSIISCFCAFVAFIGLILPLKASALDIENERPTPVRGVPSAEWIDRLDPSVGVKKSYGNPEATISIRNTAPGTLPEMRFLASCAMNSATTLSNCYYLIAGSSTRLLNSKSYVNNKMKVVVAALRYGGVNVYGDSLSGSGSYLYWGRHLRQSSDNSSSNAYWQSKDYTFNPDAQSFWNSSDPNKNATMTDTINRLSKNAKSPLTDSPVFSAGSQYTWIARPFYGICGRVAGCPDENQYPEGRIWCAGSDKNLLIRKDDGKVSYYEKGTVLVTGGDLRISASIEPAYGDVDASLGFIVSDGDVIIENPTPSKMLTVRASIFAPNGSIYVVSNGINLIGSFVASNFVVDATNVNFIQDTRGEENWPPGFRELKLPSVSN